MTGPAAGLTTWLDRPLTTTGHTHSTESHEPEWLTQLCALECTLQVRAHSLAPATCRDSANRPALGPSDHEPPRASLLVSFLGTPLQLSPFQIRQSSRRTPTLRSPNPHIFEKTANIFYQIPFEIRLPFETLFRGEPSNS